MNYLKMIKSPYSFYFILATTILTFIGCYFGLKTECHVIENYASCYKKQALAKDIYLHLCKVENKSFADIRQFIGDKPTCNGVLIDLIQLELITRFNRDLIT